MSLKYFININAPQNFANSQHSSVCYAIYVHWQLHISDANGKELAIPLHQSLEGYIESHMGVGVNDSSGQRKRKTAAPAVRAMRAR